MFLYEKNDKNIDVFSLSRNAQNIRDYRIEQMKKIPLDRRCLYTEEIYSGNGGPILFEKNLKSHIFSKEELIGKNKSLNYNTDLEDCSDLLQRFYSDKYINKSVARVDFENKLRYLLIVSNYVNFRKVNGKEIMRIEDIIEIPKSLYLLQLLEQKKFSLIAKDDISEQLNLFDFNYVNSLTLEELQRMDACGITKNAYSSTINKSDNDKHILRLLKK